MGALKAAANPAATPHSCISLSPSASVLKVFSASPWPIIASISIQGPSRPNIKPGQIAKSPPINLRQIIDHYGIWFSLRKIASICGTPEPIT